MSLEGPETRSRRGRPSLLGLSGKEDDEEEEGDTISASRERKGSFGKAGMVFGMPLRAQTGSKLRFADCRCCLGDCAL